MLRALLAGLCLAAAAANAQEFPGGTIRIITYSPPGGPNDTMARSLIEPLGKVFGQTVTIDARVGGDGIIAAQTCAGSRPDGHTLCVTGNSMISLNPVIRSKLPYDPLRDFAPVMFIGFFDSLLLVHPSVPANSVEELIELSKAKPDSLNWGHFGLNTTGNFYQEFIRKSRSAPFYPVPYKTNGQMLQALIAGEAHVVVFGMANAMTSVKAGRVKPLAITADTRVKELPNVPTFAEKGIKLPLRGWFGYHVQAATPRAVVNRWNTEVRRIMSEPSYQSTFMDKLGITPDLGTPEHFDAFIRSQLKEMKELVDYLGIKPH
jgi:tripartite-type tricarboxylate transporter receptor subunit TctC